MITEDPFFFLSRQYLWFLLLRKQKIQLFVIEEINGETEVEGSTYIYNLGHMNEIERCQGGHFLPCEPTHPLIELNAFRRQIFINATTPDSLNCDYCLSFLFLSVQSPLFLIFLFLSTRGCRLKVHQFWSWKGLECAVRTRDREIQSFCDRQAVHNTPPSTRHRDKTSIHPSLIHRDHYLCLSHQAFGKSVAVFQAYQRMRIWTYSAQNRLARPDLRFFHTMIVSDSSFACTTS